MKPKEFVSKYKMDVNEHFDHSMFVADLAIDFQSSIKYQKSVGQYTLSHFENIVKQIKQKFDSISYKSKMGIENWDKLWKFFYASVVVKARDADFGEQIRNQKQAKQEEWQRRNAWKGAFYGGTYTDSSFGFDNLFSRMFREFFSGAYSDFFMGGLSGNVYKPIIPTKEFAELGIPETSSVDEINTAFRKMALIHHPDKGGDSGKFQSILESKNRCIMYAERRT